MRVVGRVRSVLCFHPVLERHAVESVGDRGVGHAERQHRQRDRQHAVDDPRPAAGDLAVAVQEHQLGHVDRGEIKLCAVAAKPAIYLAIAAEKRRVGRQRDARERRQQP
jgi:hypothetical protein